MIRPIKVAAGWLERMPDTPVWFERHLAEPWKQYVALLLLGLALRIATFGDPNMHVDETFYFLVGQEMHKGALPYVDIWDRKPLGLFIIYYLIAGISTSVVAYQVAAWLFASSTAMVIALIARRWAGVQGAVLAGAAYLFMLGAQEGYGGQSPVFYNLLIAGAAYLLLEDRQALAKGRPGWRTFVAMAVCGIALTMKQTTLFESVFFGLFVAFKILRSGVPPAQSLALITTCAVLGAAPTAAIGAAYYALGHWHEWWQAMFLSNLAKAQKDVLTASLNLLRICLRLYPLLALVWLGIATAGSGALPKRDARFLLWWIGAAVLGVIAVPNFYTHYALPLLVPLSAASSLAFGRKDVGQFLLLFVAAFTCVLFNSADRERRVQSMTAMEAMAVAIRSHDSGGGLLVYDAPPYLYALAGKRPLTPLAFPHHMNHWDERNVSTLDTAEEVARVIRNRPGVIAMAAFPSNLPANGDTRHVVEAYVFNNCRLVDARSSTEIAFQSLIGIWGDCQPGPPDLTN